MLRGMHNVADAILNRTLSNARRAAATRARRLERASWLIVVAFVVAACALLASSSTG